MTADTKAISHAAELIYQARRAATPCAPVRDLLPAGDLAAAYAVQETNTKRWLGEGRLLSGRKIGLTSQAVQRQFDVNQPDYGMLFADMAVPAGSEVARGRLIQPKVEAEVALVMERALPGPRITLADVIGAVGYAVCAIEIVDSAIAGWNIKLVDTIADNASSGLYVLGTRPRRLEGLDLRLCGMLMQVGGQTASLGVGAACLGHPLNAVLWLAQTMAQLSRPLEAGDTVLSGALGPMAAVRWGEAVKVEIAGLDCVEVAFAKE
ncbi:MAG TPA: fumarylacetoacetate hydrolase family protein [Candidatus Binataceae bacterium]|nr:fumarylacetoacetate hydrolase family protein [Candidatus Binataceae bacterium]